MPTVKSKGYSIVVDGKLFSSISSFLSKNAYTSYYILCDENTLQQCLPLLITSCPELNSAEIIEIEAGETSKCIEFSAHIWQTLLENKADKKTLLINLGGGVVSDLGGFSASVYKRGIDFIHIPTSLLAMADASVGGKTGIDFYQVKNAVGTFAQPKTVFVYTPFLKTLPAQHFQNGLAEIYKIALVADKKLWNSLKVQAKTESLVLKSIQLKNKIVLKDPFDKGLRNILNFGHTLGHAIESLLLGTENKLLHGEAIVVGMIMETHLSFQKKLISKKDLSEITHVLYAQFGSYPLHNLSVSSLLEFMKNDKKASSGKIRFSLLSGIGSCTYNIEVNASQIKKAFDFYFNSLP